MILVPGARLKEAEFFIFHLIEFSIQLDPVAVWTVVIAGKVVADEMTAGTPVQRDVAGCEYIAGASDVGCVAHFERDMFNSLFIRLEKVQRMVVRVTTQKVGGVVSPV